MTVRILTGDCRDLLASMDPESVDSCVCDPPYGLEFMGKEWDAPWQVSSQSKLFGKRDRAMPGWQTTRNPTCRGCGGRLRGAKKCACSSPSWDEAPNTTRLRQMAGFQDWCQEWAEAVYRVLKPGAHLVAFSGTRTYHRMACAIEDAGFEIRDQLAWIYGAGFPKSHNIDKKIDDETRCCCQRTETLSERELRLVRDSDVSPPIATCATGGEVLFEGLPEQGPPRSMLRTEPKEGSAAAPEPLLEGWDHAQAPEGELQGRALCEGAGMGAADGEEGPLHHGAPAGHGANVRLPDDADGSGQSHRPQPGEQRAEQSGTVADERRPQAGGAWPLCPRCGKPDIPRGLGSALKPAWEPICLARKPLSGTLVQNCLVYGTGVLNIDGCRIEGEGIETTNGSVNEIYGDLTYNAGQPWKSHALGRWPANIIHDGSEEVLAGFPDAGGGDGRGKGNGSRPGGFANVGSETGSGEPCGQLYSDSGSAARFFYAAKATSAERGEGNHHPTVKPVALMQWLVRLVTPKGGTVLDPFAGSGSTLIAADAEQFDAIGCELSPEYAAIAERRVRAAAGLFGQVEAA